jgi:hypothetical protein
VLVESSATMLERTRQLCEDGELLEVQASEFLLREAKTASAKIVSRALLVGVLLGMGVLWLRASFFACVRILSSSTCD